MDCIFCDIIEKKANAELLYEDANVISFLDIRPVNFGHTLVIPKKHYENFLDVPSNLLGELIQVTQIMSDAIIKSLKPEGFNIVANNGVAAGQTVFHFHFHIIPRLNHDDFKFRPNFKSYLNGSMQDFADKIRTAIKR
jgi:histidine triad (HIT) family protein